MCFSATALKDSVDAGISWLTFHEIVHHVDESLIGIAGSAVFRAHQ